MRHANAQWKDPQIADFERPLNRRGTSEAETMARRLSELGLIPELLIASSALRTQQTADIVARELGIAARQVRREEGLYLAAPDDILKVIHATGPRVHHLMLIGHNPGISEAGRLFAPELGKHELATAAIYSLTFDARSWVETGPETLLGCESEAPPSGLFASLWA